MMTSQFHHRLIIFFMFGKYTSDFICTCDINKTSLALRVYRSYHYGYVYFFLTVPSLNNSKYKKKFKNL